MRPIGFALLLCLGCAPTPDHFAPAPLRAPAPLHVARSDSAKTVVLVVVDTFGADHSSTYGYARETSPNLSRIARNGTRFARATSPASWTLPAVASILSGLDPSEHGAGVLSRGGASGRAPLSESVTTLAELLGEAGWETEAWVNNPYLRRVFGLTQGFQHYFHAGTHGRELASEPIAQVVATHLRSPASTNRFFFVHLMDPHGPYKPTLEYKALLGAENATDMDQQELTDVARGRSSIRRARRDDFERLHDAAIRYADDVVGRLYDSALEGSDAEDLLFIVTADHGEEFWKHARFEHGHSVFEELLRVPLVVAGPNWPSAMTIEDRVSTRQLAATILEFADGESRTDSLRNVPEALAGGGVLYGPERHFIYCDRYKYIYHQRRSGTNRRTTPVRSLFALYDLQADPSERHNLARRPSSREALNRCHNMMAPVMLAQARGTLVLWLIPAAKPRSETVDITLHGSAMRGRRFHYLWGTKRAPVVSTANGIRIRYRARAGLVSLPLSADTAHVNIRGDALELHTSRGLEPTTGFDVPIAPLHLDQLLARSPGVKPQLWIGFIPGRRLEAVAIPSDVEEALRSLGYTQ